jgi:hypothetical protein
MTKRNQPPDRVMRAADGSIVVISGTSGTAYRVDLDRLRCSCRGSAYGRFCRHLHLAARIVETATSADFDAFLSHDQDT